MNGVICGIIGTTETDRTDSRTTTDTGVSRTHYWFAGGAPDDLRNVRGQKIDGPKADVSVIRITKNTSDTTV